MVPAIQLKHEVARAAALKGYSTATDLADYLVRKGVAFRDAHEVVGRAVRLGIDTSRDLSDLDLTELQALSSVIESDVFMVLTLEGSVAARNHFGGTAPAQVRAAIARAQQRIAAR
jgi:argininosuccinate lyase